jgi:hypothetical protein
MRSESFVVLVLVLGAGCSSVAPPRVAHLTGVHVIALGPGEASVGLAQRPFQADRVALEPSRLVLLSDCHSRDELDAAYGQRCEGFEPTAQGGKGASTPSGVSLSTPGLHPPAREEAWYCDGSWVVRLALVSCGAATADAGTRFRVDQAVFAAAAEALP